MPRSGVLLLPILGLLCLPPALFGQKSADPVATELAVQAALQQGRQFGRVYARDAAALGSNAAKWSFCRMWVVAERLNEETKRFNAGQPSDPGTLALLEREVDEVLKLTAGQAGNVNYGRGLINRI